MELKAIDARIKVVSTMGAKMNDYIHQTAVAILEHAAPKEVGGAGHGDCTRALKLVLALPKSLRRAMLINWFATYSPIGMNVGTGKVGFHREESKSFNPFDIEAAKANPFYVEQTKADEEILPDTLAEFTNNVIKFADRLKKRIDDGKVNANAVEAARNVVATLLEAVRKVA